MTLMTAFIYYGVRLVLFAAVAGVGIAVGIKLRKGKDAKSANIE